MSRLSRPPVLTALCILGALVATLALPDWNDSRDTNTPLWALSIPILLGGIGAAYAWWKGTTGWAVVSLISGPVFLQSLYVGMVLWLGP